MTEVWDNMTAMDKREDVDKARQALTERIASLTDTIRHLHLRQNELAAINRLPPELLTKIFKLLAIHPKKLRPPKDVWPYRRRPGWASASQVSYHWRAIALADASLWAGIHDDYGQEWNRVLLERSQYRDLSCHTTAASSDRRLQVVQNALHAVQNAIMPYTAAVTSLSLDLSGFNGIARIERITDGWLQDLSQSSHLKALTLAGWPGYHPNSHDFVLPEVRLSKYKHAFPNLRVLSLRCFGIPESHPLDMFRKLTVLEVHSYIVPFEQRPFRLVRLMNLLGATPQLRELHLQNAVIPGELPVDAFLVELPFLQSLHVRDLPRVCHQLISHLTFPKNTVVDVLIPEPHLRRSGHLAVMGMMETLGTKFSTIADRVVCAQLMLSKKYATWTAQINGSGYSLMKVKVSRLPASRGYPEAGYAGWVQHFETCFRVDHLVIDEAEVCTALEEVVGRGMSACFPALTRFSVKNLAKDDPAIVESIDRWVEERSRLGGRMPEKMDVRSLA